MPKIRAFNLALSLSLACLASACVVTIGPADTDNDSESATTSTDPSTGSSDTSGASDMSGTDTEGTSTSDPSAGPDTEGTSTTSGTEGTDTDTTTGDPTDLPGSCAAFCDNLFACLTEDEHGYPDQASCEDECVNAIDGAGDSCVAASIDVNACVAALDCDSVSGYWFGDVDPLPCAEENVGQLVECDTEDKCAGYCTVGVQCLSDQPGFEDFDTCLDLCVDDYVNIGDACQPPYAALNVCVAGLSCDEAAAWWNGEGDFMCAAEDDALAMCG